ncbi:MAG: iron-containing redox enzyme family protein [Kofleriaceae bacterium]|nr:iron-containing redox enzyme family protein [Kofleriaceae bacterium]
MDARSPARAIDELELHRKLRDLNERRLKPTLCADDWRRSIALEAEARFLERDFLTAARAMETPRAIEAPAEPEAFIAWFEALRENGPGQWDPLFPWLEHVSTLEQMRWFLRQEVAGEAGFDDLVALTQVRMPERAKLELARNYWDEMGRGIASAMHGPMLTRLANALELDRTTEPVIEAIALGNLLAGFACNRHFAFHAIGALGVVELTAPDRTGCVSRGLKRLGIGAKERQYYALHSTLDVAHSRAWNAEVIVPLVAEEPARALAIAEGALMRLRAGERCFQRYRRELGVST